MKISAKLFGIIASVIGFITTIIGIIVPASQEIEVGFYVYDTKPNPYKWVILFIGLFLLVIGVVKYFKNK